MRLGLLFALLLLGPLGCSKEQPIVPPHEIEEPNAAAPSEWQEITSAEHKFKIKMPGRPETKQVKTPDSRFVTNWELKGAKPAGGFNVNAGPSTIPDGMETKAFDLGRDSLLKGNAKLVSEGDFKRQGKVIGRNVEIEIPDLRLKGRTTFINANGMGYQLTMMGDASWDGWKNAGRFFDSFELLP